MKLEKALKGQLQTLRQEKLKLQAEKRTMQRQMQKQMKAAVREAVRRGGEQEKGRAERLSKMIERKAGEIQNLNKKIRELQEQLRKGTTPQLEGLNLEKELVKELRKNFEEDTIEPHGKAGDIIHRVNFNKRTTGEVYTFQSACEIFGVPASKTRKSHSRVTKPAIESLLTDVTGELELLNRLKQEFDRHPVDLAPERCYSPATLAKEYFSAMGIKPPEKKFKIPNRINGIAMQAFVAGRAECTTTRTVVPITYLDFRTQFPAVSHLLGCREILCAKSLKFPASPPRRATCWHA
jgi:hypothetical protein